jgi:tRNA pseudouridine38-40 synthase
MIFHIEGNRFLRGMVRLLTASVLQVARGKLSLREFENFFKENHRTKYSVPAHGLFLKAVKYHS